MKISERFTRIYPLSKTLRFELKPIGNTLDNLISSGLLEQDRHRDESYQQVKKIIDEYHKVFIDSVLENFKLPYFDKGMKNSLEEFYVCYMCKSKDEIQKLHFENIQKNLRKQIADSFSKDERFKRIDKKELIQKDLADFVQKIEEQQLIKEFKNFTTYFENYHNNRKNMYSAEAHSTAIAYRLIHENLPRFIDNISVFDKIAVSPVAEHLTNLYADFAEYLNVGEMAEMFRLDYYNTVLTQKQIDVYNAVIGGKTIKESNIKIKGLNEYINLYNQHQKDKAARLPKLKPLYKQILSDRNAISWLPERFESDKNVLEAIQCAYQELKCVFDTRKDGSLKELLQSLANYDLDKIYIRNDQLLTDISKTVFGHWEIISKALLEDMKRVAPKKSKKETDEAYEKRLSDMLKSKECFSIARIDRCVQAYKEQMKEEMADAQNVDVQSTLLSHFATLGAVNTATHKKENLFVQIEDAYAGAEDLLNTPYPVDKNLAQDKLNIEKIKNLLDAIKNLQHFVKPLLCDGAEIEKDERFYGEFVVLWDELYKITSLYNMVRNYMTRKPYSTEKIKLNFENSTLMKGWDLNKEKDNTTVILRKDGLYYLAIMNKKHNKVFSHKNMPSEGDCYEKMEYKLLPGANKMLPKVFFSKSRIQEFAPSKTLLRNYKNGTHKKGENFSINDCHTLIDFFKESIAKHEDWSKFGFHFSDTSGYEDMSDFYREVEQQGYNIAFRNVSANYIDSLVKQGKIYLFQIYNKDFSPYSKGAPNLHTLYWKMLFDERNLVDVVYKLNGEAEVFFRKSSLKYDHPTHPANKPIANKNVLNKKKQSSFAYHLIKDKRYTIDKFQFHVPITMNFKSTGNDNINQSVNGYVKQADDLHVIGIDRGERHLLYLTVIDLKGNIKEQYSLNEIVNEYNGNEYRTNYHSLLSKREKDIMESRKSWQTIENIKELKEGYLSQVIHKISELMIKYNAIVVLEDLNMGFKRSRQKVESSVYQKFEKMLIDKLNFLVDKKMCPEESGGILNAYQLTSKFISFQKLGKQSGFLYYVSAWNTSKIDPVTGFVNLLDTGYETREKAKAFFCTFDAIRYNNLKGWFEFTFDYDKFTTKAAGTRTCWTICSYGKRIETFRDEKHKMQWNCKEIELTDEFKRFFAEYEIDINGNLKEEIAKQDSVRFFKQLLYLLRLTLQMRNSATNTDIDYIQSPVTDEYGVFYNSSTCDDSLPQNADANGAYNIARKGLWIVRQIKSADALKNLKLAISNKEWLHFVQTKPYLND